MDVRVVVEGQLANATPCQACILRLLKNGITARTTGNLVTIQPDLMLLFGGFRVIFGLGSSLFSPAQTTALSGIRPEPLDSLNDECFTRVFLLSSRYISLLKIRFGKI